MLKDSGIVVFIDYDRTIFLDIYIYIANFSFRIDFLSIVFYTVFCRNGYAVDFSFRADRSVRLGFVYDYKNFRTVILFAAFAEVYFQILPVFVIATDFGRA